MTNIVRLKIIKCTDSTLETKIITLEYLEEMTYYSKELDLLVCDTWDELATIKNQFELTGCKNFFNLHLFIMTPKDLIFITEIDYLPKKTYHYE